MTKKHDIDNGDPFGTAFVFVTHLFSHALLREYRRIVRAVDGLGTAWFVYQGEEFPRSLQRKVPNVFLQTRQDLAAPEYPRIASALYPGSTHFPFVNFFSSHPEYDRYWMIEYDVRFSGDWRGFFLECTSIKADLLTAHINTFSSEPDWFFWQLSHPHLTIPIEDRLRCFHPIMRLTNPAIRYLRDAHADGWCGHSEVLIPSLLARGGFHLVDLGGEGEFTPAELRNRFYTSSASNPKGLLNEGTFRFRPAMARAGRERGKLYHPVKPLLSLWKDRLRVFLVRVFGKPLAGKLIDSATIILRKTAK